MCVSAESGHARMVRYDSRWGAAKRPKGHMYAPRAARVLICASLFDNARAGDGVGGGDAARAGCANSWLMDLQKFDWHGRRTGFHNVPVEPEVAAFLKRTQRHSVAQDYLQDTFLREIMHCVGTTNRFYVEFGYNTDNFEVGSGANTAALHLQGWRGLLLDGDHNNATINLHSHFLFQSNIERLFHRYSVPLEFDYLSVDMDSHDLFVLRSILKAGFRPRVLTTEFNPNYWGRPLAISQLDPTLGKNALPKDYTFTYKRCAWGASSYAFEVLGHEFGYTLVAIAVGHGSDLYFVRNDVLAPSAVKPSRIDLFGYVGLAHSHIKPGSVHADPLQLQTPVGRGPRSERFLWHGPGWMPSEIKILDAMIDYETYVRTGDVQGSVAAATDILRRNMSDTPCWEGLFMAKHHPTRWHRSFFATSSYSCTRLQR